MRVVKAIPAIVWLVAASVLLASAAMAQAPDDGQARARAARLDTLFAILANATDQTRGDEIVADIWKTWLESGIPQIDAQMQQAVAIMAQGLPALALPILDDIVSRASGWAEGWNKRATVLYLIGEHERSVADIQRVLALEPRHFGALAGLGLIHIAREEYRDALAAFRRALRANPFLKERFALIPELEKKVGERPL